MANENLDDILKEVEEKKNSPQPETTDKNDARMEKVRNFSLQLDLGEDDDEATPLSQVKVPEAPDPAVAPASTVSVKAAKPRKKSLLRKIIYIFVVLIVSVGLASFLIGFMTELIGLNQSETPVDVEIPAGASTQQIAQILADNGVIKTPLYFRLYSKVTHTDGTFQLGMFTVSGDMGYGGIITTLQTMKPRETITVTIPEGYTIADIAKVLASNGVCEQEEFFKAVQHEDYDFDFVKAIPDATEGSGYEGRVYRLEGYLFPDTYNFYVGCTGKAAVQRMLENFDSKLTKEFRAEINASGRSINDIVIIASIIQGEAPHNDMTGVSRVIYNRLAEGSSVPMLQCDSTQKYVRALVPNSNSDTIITSAYDTYQRVGLPVGAINNPGLNALQAAVHPSTDANIMKCYFFANDTEGNTYFSKTYSEHVATCRRHRIGMYG